MAGKGHHAGPGLSAGVHRGLCAGLLGNVRRHAVAEAVAFRRTRLERVPAERTCPSAGNVGTGTHGRSAGGTLPPFRDGRRYSQDKPQPPPLTSLSSGGLASPSSAPVPGSLDDRLVNPGPEDWKERYQYAALKYNQVVEDYNRLKKLYMNLVGRSGAAGGLVTGAQFYKALRKDTRAEARKLDERYMKGGMRGSELRELERSRDEMRHRDWWLKKMARQFQID